MDRGLIRMRLATGLMLLIGVLLGVAGDDWLRQGARDRRQTALSVNVCAKGDLR
jgi:hypothetical protein